MASSTLASWTNAIFLSCNESWAITFFRKENFTEDIPEVNACITISTYLWKEFECLNLKAYVTKRSF